MTPDPDCIEVKVHENSGDCTALLLGTERVGGGTVEIFIKTRDNTGYAGIINIIELKMVIDKIKKDSEKIGNVSVYTSISTEDTEDHNISRFKIGLWVDIKPAKRVKPTFETDEGYVKFFFWTKDNSSYSGYVSLHDLTMAVSAA